MTHEKYTEQISQWIDGDLNADDVNKLQTHLSDCPACTQFYQAMQQVEQALNKAVMVSPPPGFTQRFETRLQAQQIKQGRLWLGMTILIMSTLAMFVAAGAFAWIMFSGLENAWILSTFYYYLGRMGSIVNEARAVVNLSSLFIKASVMTMREPIFWSFTIITLALVATWVRVMQMIYRRTPIATATFA